MKSIIRRIDNVEKEIGGTCVVPEKERHIVIPYPADQEDVFEHLKQEKIKGLKEKYGPNINEADLFIVGIRKFYRKQLSSDDATPKAGENGEKGE
jgi:hypothetical protein